MSSYVTWPSCQILINILSMIPGDLEMLFHYTNFNTQCHNVSINVKVN
jgi:hypothetical protein